jgi:hypothetical protein
MIDKETAIEMYKDLVKMGTKEFAQTIMGSHVDPRDGWRTASLGETYLTFEKNPGYYGLYNKEVRFTLTEEEGIELVKIFDK